MMPPSPTIFSASSAFIGSPEATYSKTLVSKKLPGIRLFPVELEIGREAPAESAQALQQLITPGLARDAKLTTICDMDFDVIARFQLKSLDHRGRKADGEA